jgi:hypothetical protein
MYKWRKRTRFLTVIAELRLRSLQCLLCALELQLQLRHRCGRLGNLNLQPSSHHHHIIVTSSHHHHVILVKS